MPTTYTKETKESRERKIQQGRGYGEGPDYTPWIFTHEVPSLGLSSNPKSYKCRREMHLLSDLEFRFFLVAEYSPIVSDIREQFPLLDIDETIAIAKQHGIKHPIDPGSREEKVMTTDFLLTFVDGHEPLYQAIAVKSSQSKDNKQSASNNSLTGKRTLEKLEIERLFWEKRDIPWKIITERDVSDAVFRNLKNYHGNYVLRDAVPEQKLAAISAWLETQIRSKQKALREITTECDQHFDLEHGIGLHIVWNRLAHKQWETNIHKIINPEKPLHLLDERKAK